MSIFTINFFIEFFRVFSKLIEILTLDILRPRFLPIACRRLSIGIETGITNVDNVPGIPADCARNYVSGMCEPH